MSTNVTTPKRSPRGRADIGLLPDLLACCAHALASAQTYVAQVKSKIAQVVSDSGIFNAELFEREQFAAHGLAWCATYVVALEQMLAWAQRLDSRGRLGENERIILQCAFGEYLAQLTGGIFISQVEAVRPTDLGMSETALASLQTDSVRKFLACGNTAALRERLAERLAEQITRGVIVADKGLDDEGLEQIQEQFERFANEEIGQAAHGWHLADELIPLHILEKLSALGVFGLTIPEEYEGLGLGKAPMCAVTEELSRAYLGVGSLATRAEIAAELINVAGTKQQKQRWLPGIATGAILPTAVFTEPDTGSDLGSVRTRALREGDVYRITGNKTWITHAARADLMIVLARTNMEIKGHTGLSIFLAEKPRGSESDPFPVEGLSGTEIRTLGYRGMKEYELAFDNFPVSAEALLGGMEGLGFKQLMATFESARIQTAARAVGVAQNALDLGVSYAVERQQFGKKIIEFPRIGGKLAWMAVETMIARQLTYFAARTRDSGRRCDVEAGMAKLLAARVAWSNADNALQVHGGNGYAEEYAISRVLCDARILNIFEGAAEIQAGVIARGLLQGILKSNKNSL